MADPTGGDALAQIIAASGTAIAAVLGAIVLWPTRRRRERAALTAVSDDPEDRTTRIRERLTALETNDEMQDRRLEHLEDEIPLLRAQGIAAESIARFADHVAGPRPRRRS